MTDGSNDNAASASLEAPGLLRRVAGRYWLILFFVVLGVAGGVAYLKVTQPLYKISAQIVPGISGFKSGSKPEYQWTAQDLCDWVMNRTTLMSWSSLLGDDVQAPFIKASTHRKSKIASISFYWPDPEKGKAMLATLLDYMESGGPDAFRKHLEISRRGLEDDFNSVQEEIALLGVHEERLGSRIEQSAMREKVMRERMTSLDRRRRNVIKRSERLAAQLERMTDQAAATSPPSSAGGTEALLRETIAMQRNAATTQMEIQLNNVSSATNKIDQERELLVGRIADLREEVEDLTLVRDRELPLKRDALEKELKAVRQRIDSLSVASIVQVPYSTEKPVRPNKKRVMIASVFIGGLWGCIIAVGLEGFALLRRRDK